MKLNNLEENDDGSVTANLDLNQEEAQMLMQIGFVKLLEEAIEADKRRRRTPALFQAVNQDFVGNYGGDSE